MFISIIIIVSCFLIVVFLIVTERLNRAIAALAGAIITYFVLIFIEGYDFLIIVELLFSTQSEGFVNLHSLILILAMMMIVAISNEAGTFQFISITLIKLSKGRPVILLTILCSLTVLLSSLLNNILTVIILIPLTITISRILNIDPSPYVLTQAVLVNIGGTVFSISSIPNILIATYAGISFIDFFINIGTISLIIFIFTLIFFILLYKKELKIPQEGVQVLREFNVWNFIQNKKLLYESVSALIIVLLLFMIIPTSFITPDIIALFVAIILILVSRIDPKVMFSKIDFELLVYLLGVFVLAGSFEILGIADFLGAVLFNIGGGNLLIQLIVILWISSFLSSAIDNIPITKVLIPIIDTIPYGGSLLYRNQAFYSLAIGANWGDNLTPLGDNILVVNLAEQNKRPISFRQFFKIGFVTTVFQLAITTIIIIILFDLFMGIVIILVIFLFLMSFYLLYSFSPKHMKIKLEKTINKIKMIIIK
ncbi:MAG: SLC13 family permease [Promethearchaeota archaeon]